MEKSYLKLLAILGCFFIFPLLDADAQDGLSIKQDGLSINIDADALQPKACINLSKEKISKNTRVLKSFIITKPSRTLDVIERNGKACISGLDWGQGYTFVLKKGLPFEDGSVLKKELAKAILIPNAPASIGFSGKGYILAQTDNTHLPLTTRNIKTVKLTVLRVVERNLIEKLRRPGSLTKNIDGYDIHKLSQTDGEIVWEGHVDVEAKTNRMVKTGIPLKGIVDFTVPGVHVVVAENPNEKVSRWRDRATQWVFVSDLGVMSFRSNQGLSVFVSSHAHATPVFQAKVSLIARNNRVLGAAETDVEGRVDFPPGLLRGEGGSQATGLTVVYGDNDFTALSLVSPAMDLSDRGVSGRKTPGPMDGFVYGDRDIYRPGETAHISALVRNELAMAEDGLPLWLKLVRPDGKVLVSRQLKTNAAGMVTTDFVFPKSSSTGPWQVKLHIDPEHPAIGAMRLFVEDFVPERLEMELNASLDIYAPAQMASVQGIGRFLFGAPASELNVTSELIIEKDPDPFPKFKEYAFGLVTEDWSIERKDLEKNRTDKSGKYDLAFKLPNVGDTTLPLRARVRSTLLEPGGRGLARSTTFKLRNSESLHIGIKSQFTSAQAKSKVNFHVIVLDSKGAIVENRALTWELIRERRHYDWIRSGGVWDAQITVRDEHVSGGKLTSLKKAAEILTKVDWGHYRLEVYDPVTGMASSLRFKAGWWSDNDNAQTPDEVILTLDKSKYQAGETVRLNIKPPYEGTALLTVLSNGIVEAHRLEIPKDGLQTELTVKENWGVAGAYVAVTLLKPSSDTTAPTRAVGIHWVEIDQSSRTLSVQLDAPEKIRPSQMINIPLRVEGLSPGEKAWVTLSAVDQGVLSLTGYGTPNPRNYYFSQRQLGTELRDTYGHLINPAFDQVGRLRAGGDAMGRHNQGLNVNAYETVALFSGLVELSAEGKADIPIEIPRFNGSLRLMAVAASHDKMGSGETDLTVRAPIVGELSRPRFLAPGDTAHLNLELHNVEAEAGQTKITFTSHQGVTIDIGVLTANTKAGDRAQWSIPIMAHDIGVGRWSMTLSGPGDFIETQNFKSTIRPLQPVQSERHVLKLSGTGIIPFGAHKISVSKDIISGYLANTTFVSLMLGAGTGFYLPHLIQYLNRYPYGCLEQTISTTLPLLYLSELAEYVDVGVYTADLRKAVEHGIQRLGTMQLSNGAFGYWSARADAEPWLTVYALDFMVRAKAAGFQVPDHMYQQTLEWVADKAVKRANDLFERKTAQSVRAYAIYVLAKAGHPQPAWVRYWSEQGWMSHNTLERQLLLTTAHMTGVDVAKTLGEQISLLRSGGWSRTDFGSPLRDGAMRLSLMVEGDASDQDILELAENLDRLIAEKTHLNTQEMAWLALAGKAMLARYGPVDALVDGRSVRQDKPFGMRVMPEQLASGLNIENRSSDPVLATFMVSGVPERALPPQANGYSVRRILYTLNGEPVDISRPLSQGERYIVILDGDSHDYGHRQTLLVDMLPAGLEIENTRLMHGGKLEDFSWLENVTTPQHMELRDDRFVAAMESLKNNQDYKLAYIVRAVTPGTFTWPAAYVEDMYRPDRFARGKLMKIKIETRR